MARAAARQGRALPRVHAASPLLPNTRLPAARCAQEDTRLAELVSLHGPKKWAQISLDLASNKGSKQVGSEGREAWLALRLTGGGAHTQHLCTGWLCMCVQCRRRWKNVLALDDRKQCVWSVEVRGGLVSRHGPSPVPPDARRSARRRLDRSWQRHTVMQLQQC
jgi:hypothetical protein